MSHTRRTRIPAATSTCELPHCVDARAAVPSVLHPRVAVSAADRDKPGETWRIGVGVIE